MAFVKRARLPQAEDSAPMRVSRIGTSSQRSPRLSPRPYFTRRRAVFQAPMCSEPEACFRRLPDNPRFAAPKVRDTAPHG